MSPRSQVTTPAANGSHDPASGVLIVELMFEESVLVSVTPVAVSGPLFVTVTVYNTSSPAITGSGVSACVT